MKKREGAKHVANLPNEGPWQLLVFGDTLFALSQGALYEVIDTKVRKVRLVEAPPITVTS